MPTGPCDVAGLTAGKLTQIALDERFATNGNYAVAVDGYLLPGAVAARYNPAPQQYNDLQTDARSEPEARLRSYSEGSLIELDLATQQASVLDRVWRQGCLRLDKDDTNSVRQIGTAGSLPTTPDGDTGAEWALLKITPNASDWDAVYPAVLKAQVDSDTSTWKACTYIPNTPAPASFVSTTDVYDIDAKTALANPYLGRFVMTAVTNTMLPSGARYSYDPATVYTVQTASSIIPVDFVDPTLQTGDDCAIFGFSYQYLQLENTDDYSYYTPYGRRIRSVVELIKCLGETERGYIFERKTFFHCEQQNILGAAGSGSSGAVQSMTFQFWCRQQKGRLALSRMEETSYIILQNDGVVVQGVNLDATGGVLL